MIISHLCILFGEMSAHILCRFSNWILYIFTAEFGEFILNMSPFLHRWLANICSLSVAFLFIFSTWGPTEQKFLILRRSNLLIFRFADYTFDGKSDSMPQP